MQKFAILLAAALLATPALADQPGWPPVTVDARPWTRWWWMGDAVNPQDLTRELETFQKAGLGGVEITPIYGVKGYESQFIPFLSPKWMEMLHHTVSEAHRVGMEADMTTGSGWCMGGPNVSDADANASVQVKQFDVRAGDPPLQLKLANAPSRALVAFSPDGKCVDLTQNIAVDGSASFTPAGATGDVWRVFQVWQQPSGVKVKRAAPGGEGWMLNLLYPDAMPRYLARFADAFAKSPGPIPHSLFHDSYEYKSDWSPDFFAQFEKRRGYKLQTELPALFNGQGDPDHVARVKCDYRETVSELIEQSIGEWTAFAHQHGMTTREQAHGSPGNLLDIYAAADIPETEFFYKDRDILASKFASSAAHVTGKQLTGAETGTWVAEHFTETLGEMKSLCDDMFLAGVNRITYHGTAYSPADAPWPGWCFYASAEMNPRNAIWRDVSTLNNYVARCQSMLQSGRPDNDILLYWPIYDLWHNPKGMAVPLAIHANEWLEQQPAGRIARSLWDGGYSFDYISDEQLQAAKVTGSNVILDGREAIDDKIDLSGNKFSRIIVPECQYMPLDTLRKLFKLAEAGATIVFENHFPLDVPGLNDLANRQKALKTLLQSAKFVPCNGYQVAQIGTGEVWVGNLDLMHPAWPQEIGTAISGVQSGIPEVHYVRRELSDGFLYFIVNRGSKPVDGLFGFRAFRGLRPGGILVMDPMAGRIGEVSMGVLKSGASIPLHLMPGQSIFVRTLNAGESAPPWPYNNPAGTPVPLTGQWQVHFVEGGPDLPADFTTGTLGSWAQQPDPKAQSFAGAARYTLHFDAPAVNATAWSLDFGKVCQSARVRLNGKDLGTLICAPYRVDLPAGSLLPKNNLLEVEVTNTSANRVRDLDRRKVPWKHFYDTNIVSVNYKPFDASKWPLADSGLLGPVTLIPCAPLPSP